MPRREAWNRSLGSSPTSERLTFRPVAYVPPPPPGDPLSTRRKLTWRTLPVTPVTLVGAQGRRRRGRRRHHGGGGGGGRGPCKACCVVCGSDSLFWR
ncbi:unnamed protein product [Spirodela intermedia]|uniref:Uncharacterized protein n=1 Tax=Spirodela intermedia TaxID=51605 RepID=A0A7I8LDV0_SPIIN|nr:unnamed protein product [Spirodela intermedia]